MGSLAWGALYMGLWFLLDRRTLFWQTSIFCLPNLFAKWLHMPRIHFFRKGVLCELVFFFSKEVKFLIVFYVCFLPHQYFSWRDRGCTTTLLAFKRGDFSAVIVSFILKFTPIIKKYTTSFSIPKLWSTECDWLYLMSFFFHFPLSFLSS